MYFAQHLSQPPHSLIVTLPEVDIADSLKLGVMRRVFAIPRPCLAPGAQKLRDICTDEVQGMFEIENPVRMFGEDTLLASDASERGMPSSDKM